MKLFSWALFGVVADGLLDTVAVQVHVAADGEMEIVSDKHLLSDDYDRTSGAGSGGSGGDPASATSLAGCPDGVQRLANIPEKQTKMSEVLAFRCCNLDNNNKVAMSDYGCHTGTYSDAIDMCKEKKLALCTTHQIKEKTQCGSGCLYDSSRVWTRTPSPPVTSWGFSKKDNGVRCSVAATLDENDCRTVSIWLDKVSATTFAVMNSSKKPPNCFRNEEKTTVFFNTHETGNVDANGARSICRAIEE